MMKRAKQYAMLTKEKHKCTLRSFEPKIHSGRSKRSCSEKSMTAIVIRIALAPLLVGGCSLASRKWGAAIGGLLLGLPLLSGPVSVILLTERGLGFAQSAARGTILGLLASSVFCAAYAAASRRLAWWGSLLVGYGAFGSAVALFSLLHLTLAWSLVLVSAALVVLVLATGRPGVAGPAPAAPKWDLPVRMVVTGALVVGVSMVAGYLSPEAAGLLAPIPVLGAVMAVFTHRRSGAEAARGLLHGAVIGSWGGVAFFTAVVLLLGSVSPLAAYAVALCAAAVAGGTVMLLSSAAPRVMRFAGHKSRGDTPKRRSLLGIALRPVARSS
jgi:hypothetical protein